jgi:hypothetical protein
MDDERENGNETLYLRLWICVWSDPDGERRWVEGLFVLWARAIRSRFWMRKDWPAMIRLGIGAELDDTAAEGGGVSSRCIRIREGKKQSTDEARKTLWGLDRGSGRLPLEAG